jgi:serine/threonine-protein kinase
VDARADIWALGAILHELLSGKPPFQGSTLVEVINNVMHGSVERLGARRPDVPPELDTAIGRCLAKSPDDRFASTAELARALEPFAPRRSLLSIERIERVARRADPEAEPPSSAEALAPLCEKTLRSPSDLPSPGGSSRERRRAALRHWATGVGFVAFAAAISITAALVANTRRSTEGSGRVPAVNATRTTTAETADGAPPSAEASSSAGLPAHPEPRVVAPSIASARAADASTGQTIGPRATSLPRHRNPDTTEFGGLE